MHALADSAPNTCISWNIINDAALPNDDAFTPRVGLVWQARLSIYGNPEESYDSSDGQTASLTPLPPESAQQWEIGAKAEASEGWPSATLTC